MDEQLDDMQPLPKSKAELIERIETARTALDSVIDRLSDTQVVAAGPYEGWSVKDHIVHLATWEAGIAALLRRKPRYPAMGFAGQLDPIVEEQQTLYRPEAMDADELNAMIFERNKERSMDEVRVQFRETQRSLLDALGPLDDVDLRKTYSHYQPDEPGEDSGEPIVRWVAGNTYEHYAEHQEWIEALIEGAGQTSA